ncbi:Glycine cleavage system H protein [gamma proteobacterium IMCC1989]|nr:Glycine cleavage system H protein [gamma proteobacterium IMCC1989]
MRKYTEDHEWLEIDGNIATVGITEHATTQLGDLVYVELPDVDDEVSTGDEVVVIESVKAAGEVLAPCNGRIVEVNTALIDDAEIVSNTPESDGWLFKLQISDLSDIESMLDRDAYEKLI